MRGNTISLKLQRGAVARTGNLFQYDYGQNLVLLGVDLPVSYEVHFSNEEHGNSKTSIGNSEGVVIPDEFLLSGENVHVWLFLHDGEDDGETEYHGVIGVTKRAKPTDIQPTPVQQDVITQTISALNNAVEAIPGTIDTALAEAKASGEFDGRDGQDGADGHSPVVTANKVGKVTTVSVDGEAIATINDGTDGQDGHDGYTPIKGVDYFDGQDGRDGTDGVDGFSPTATVTKSGKVATITITDKNGTTSETVSDGSDGDPTAMIDDTAGVGDTGKAWSANKSATENGALLSAIEQKQDIDTAVRYVLARKFNVGENLLTNETTFTGTGWSGSLTNGFTHATGNTEPLVLQVETEEDKAYIIDFDYSGDIGGDNMFVTIGDMPKVDVYHGSIRPFVGIISDGGYLKISTKSTYTGTITNLKIRTVLESGGTEVIFECAEITNGQNLNEISSWHNVAIGRDVLSKNVNGTRTVAIGDRALEKIVTGHRNIAIGSYAMPFVTEGDCNVSIGADTLYNPSMSTGESKAYSNVAIGKGTMRNGELVQNNIAIGQGAMSENNVNAQENVCIGRQAGYNTKGNNTFIGHRAGYYYNGDAGINNVCIGHDAGFNAYHNGFNNVYIGAEARANVSGASASTPKTCNNSIAIGKGAYVTGSYQIVIGNANYTTVKIAGKTLVFNQDGTVTWS